MFEEYQSDDVQEKILVISRWGDISDKGHIRYLLRPDAAAMRDTVKDEDLDSYDYFLIHHTDEEFEKETEDLFAEAVQENTLYIAENGKLVKIE